MHLRVQTLSCRENVDIRGFGKGAPESGISLSGNLASIDGDKIYIDDGFVVGDSRYLNLKTEATKREQVIPGFHIGRHKEETIKSVLEKRNIKKGIGYLWVNIDQAREEFTGEKLDFNECSLSFQLFVNEQHFEEIRKVLIRDSRSKELCFDVEDAFGEDAEKAEQGCLTFGTLPDEMVLKTAKKKEGKSSSYTTIPINSLSITNTFYEIEEPVFQLGRRLKEAEEETPSEAAVSKDDKIIALLKKQNQQLGKINKALIWIGVVILIGAISIFK